MKRDPNFVLTVSHLKRFLENFPDSAPVSFIVDSARAKVWEMYGINGPIISLQTALLQDAMDAIDWEPPDAS